MASRSRSRDVLCPGDEHNADGSVDESAKNAVEQMEKRLRKMKALERELRNQFSRKLKMEN